ncbi:MAG: hypothetical protein WAQ98_25905 [Blastocatellia bacterium]
MSANKIESIYSEIEASLSQTEKLYLIQKVINSLLPSKTDLESIQLSPRIPGLHLGNAWISDDFNEPLSDEFWLGQQN